jgi:peptidyl-prolyl cis-trans isomerase D
MNTFKNSREAVEKDYRYHQAEQQFFDLADQLGTLTFEHSDTLETAAEVTNLQIQESDWFDRDGITEGLTSSSRVIEASFSEDVLVNGHNSDVLEITDRELVVLRVIGHNPKAIRPLAEVREDIIKDFIFTQADKKSADLGQQIITELRNGAEFSVIAEQHHVEWQTAKDIKRDDDSLNRAVLRTAFSLGQPVDVAPVIGGISLGTGDYAVIVVQSVKKPEIESLEEEVVENTRIQLETARATGSWQQYLQHLRANADITLFRDRIQ